jgi:hypothetical protein
MKSNGALRFANAPYSLVISGSNCSITPSLTYKNPVPLGPRKYLRPVAESRSQPI